MEIGFPILLAIVMFVRGLVLRARLRSLGQEVAELRRVTGEGEQRIAALTRRVYDLEKQREPEPTVVQEPVVQPVAVFADPMPPANEASLAAIPQTPAAAPEPAQAAPQNWEAALGENWLNRIGALVLVIGIALFLGYSLTQMGPAGKVSIGWAIGASMLAAGVMLRSHERYGNFSLGLIGGGWAVIYFTAYAMHGLDAARVIQDPAVGTLLLLCVSAAMILHSLSYRSQTATGLAYFAAFVSLNLTPVTRFSVIATFVLAVSLLVLAWRSRWFHLALAGVAFTYLTFILRYDPALYSQPGLWSGHTVLWLYWILFESYDLLHLRRKASYNPVLSLVNAFAFLACAGAHEAARPPGDWAGFFTMAAIAFGVSAATRAAMAPSDRQAPLEVRLRSGGFEVQFAIAAALFSSAIVYRFTGTAMALALLIEAQIIVAAGLVLRDRYLVGLGGLFLTLPFARVVLVDIADGGRISFAGRQWNAWTPVALLMAAVFAFNRIVTGRGWIYSLATGFLLAVVSAHELPKTWVPPVWAWGAWIAFFAGSILARRELRIPSYVLSFAAAGWALVIAIEGSVRWERITAVCLTVAAIYACWHVARKFQARIERFAFAFFALLGTALLTALIFAEVRERVTIAAGIEGVLLLAAGFAFRERIFRLCGLALFLFCIAKLFVYDLSELDTMNRILSFIVLGLLMLGASWVYTRFRDKIRELL